MEAAKRRLSSSFFDPNPFPLALRGGKGAGKARGLRLATVQSVALAEELPEQLVEEATHEKDQSLVSLYRELGPQPDG
jgi:predicted ATPase